MTWRAQARLLFCAKCAKVSLQLNVVKSPSKNIFRCKRLQYIQLARKLLAQCSLSKNMRGSLDARKYPFQTRFRPRTVNYTRRTRTRLKRAFLCVQEGFEGYHSSRARSCCALALARTRRACYLALVNSTCAQARNLRAHYALALKKGDFSPEIDEGAWNLSRNLLSGL